MSFTNISGASGCACSVMPYASPCRGYVDGEMYAALVRSSVRWMSGAGWVPVECPLDVGCRLGAGRVSVGCRLDVGCRLGGE